MAKILTVSRKSHHPIEILLLIPKMTLIFMHIYPDQDVKVNFFLPTMHKALGFAVFIRMSMKLYALIITLK